MNHLSRFLIPVICFAFLCAIHSERVVWAGEDNFQLTLKNDTEIVVKVTWPAIVQRGDGERQSINYIQKLTPGEKGTFFVETGRVIEISRDTHLGIPEQGLGQDSAAKTHKVSKLLDIEPSKKRCVVQ